MSANDIIAREITEVYTTPEQRAAYRAGMSSAAALCDEKAATVRRNNPGRKKGSASQIGEFGAHIAESCGDDIMKAREEVTANVTPEQEAHQRKMRLVRKVLG